MACLGLFLISALLHVGTAEIGLGCSVDGINIPEGCKCVNPDQPMISCQSLGLPNVPNVRRAHLLDLGNNSISRLPANAFAHISGLKKLYLNKNKIQHIDLNAFANLDLEVLDLSDNAFRDVPSMLREHHVRASTLNLENNDISSLQASMFTHVTGLKKLYLAKNKIDFVHANAFDGLYLDALDLSDNILTTIPAMFGDNQSELTNLTFLGLSKNFISTLNNNGFNGLPNLRYLYLGDNPVSCIQPEAWVGPSTLEIIEFSADSLDILKIPTSNLEKVTSLAITGARAQRLDFMKPWFESFPLVRHLKLNNVGLRDTHMKKGDFPTVWKTQLQSLSLRRNELTTIPYRSLNLTSLEDLDLSENMIENDQGYDDQGFDYIVPNPLTILKFNISNNVLSSVKSAKILSLKNARKIDLSNNHLSFIFWTHSKIDQYLWPDVVLYLGGNSWFCRCRYKWMKDLAEQQGHKHITDYEVNNTYRCGNGKHSGKLIRDMPKDFFVCSSRRRH